METQKNHNIIIKTLMNGSSCEISIYGQSFKKADLLQIEDISKYTKTENGTMIKKTKHKLIITEGLITSLFYGIIISEHITQSETIITFAIAF